MFGLNANLPSFTSVFLPDPPFCHEYIRDKSYPGIDHVKMHWVDMKALRKNQLPGPQGNGREGEGITPDHESPVPGDLAPPGGHDADAGKGKPQTVQKYKGNPAGQQPVGAYGQDHSGREINQQDIVSIDPANGAVKGPVVFEQGSRELREAGQQGQDGRKDVHIKGCLPPGVANVGLLESQKSHITAEGGVVDQDAQHQIGGYA